MGDVDEKFKLSSQGFSSCFWLGKKGSRWPNNLAVLPSAYCQMVVEVEISLKYSTSGHSH